MFWKNYTALCAKQGASPNAVAKSLSIASGTVTNWKNGAVPQNATLKKIADYFNVTIDDLLRDEEKEQASQPADELNELLQELKTRPEMRMLFSLAKGATKEDVELAITIIERMRRDESDG